MKPIMFAKSMDGLPAKHRQLHQRVLHSDMREGKLSASSAVDDDVPRSNHGLSLWAAAERKGRQLTPIEAPPRPIAPFMQDITVFIQAQLQALDRKYEGLDGGRRPMSEPEYFQQRHNIFHSGERMFADAFKTYRLFLDAVAEEHQRYVAYLSRRLELQAEEMARRESEAKTELTELLNERSVWLSEKRLVTSQVARERSELEAMKVAHIEFVVREKAAVPDAARKVMEVQLKNTLLSQENQSLTAEVEKLRRLNASLTVDTFSDALQRTSEQLRETTALLAIKEDQATDAQDAVEDLTRDLRRMHELLTNTLRRSLDKSELRLTKRGLDALMYEETPQLTMGDVAASSGVFP